MEFQFPEICVECGEDGADVETTPHCYSLSLSPGLYHSGCLGQHCYEAANGEWFEKMPHPFSGFYETA